MQALYRDLDATWAGGGLAQSTIGRARLPLQVAHTVVDLDRLPHEVVALQLDASILPQGPGLALSWVGTAG